ncbi:MAG: hypothetical protein ACLQVD_07630 [Capsulimonadaceae bacterium]
MDSHATNNNASPIGEVVESSTTSFVAQCLEVPRESRPRLYDPPSFGSFVKIGRPGRPDAVPEDSSDEPDPFADPKSVGSSPLPPAIFALVVGAATTSIEPNRRPSALGYDDEREISLHQPQIFELLRTDFFGRMIAHSDGNILRRHLPPTPPRLHARVYRCEAVEVRMLTEDLAFLRGLLQTDAAAAAAAPPDELVSACLREARRAQFDDSAFLVRAGKTLAAILADDYDRLQAILRNVL